MCLSPTHDHLRKFFDKYDKNGDGHLDEEEVKQAFKELGSLFPWWRAGQGLKYADVNKDGVIDREEIEALVTYILNKGFKLQ